MSAPARHRLVLCAYCTELGFYIAHWSPVGTSSKSSLRRTEFEKLASAQTVVQVHPLPVVIFRRYAFLAAAVFFLSRPR
jgi:hypothetical protein